MSFELSGMGYDNISYLSMGWAYIASIGWYIVGFIFALWYTYPYFKERFMKWKLKRDEDEYAAKYHKNIDLMQERLAGLEASRQKMQERYSNEVALAQQREEERRKKKAEEQRNLLEQSSSGRKLGTADEASTSEESKSNSWKPEYKPLMGDGNRGYRPPKRSCCRKGGCG